MNDSSSERASDLGASWRRDLVLHTWGCGDGPMHLTAMGGPCPGGRPVAPGETSVVGRSACAELFFSPASVLCALWFAAWLIVRGRSAARRRGEGSLVPRVDPGAPLADAARRFARS